MKRILIVDDSEVNLFLIQTIFEDDPEVAVFLESNSANALSRIREGIPDVLILDLMMPYIDGFQLLHQIKADPGLNQIPILVISSRHDEEAIQTVMDYGVNGYIKKPIDLNEIENRIRDLLDARTLKIY